MKLAIIIAAISSRSYVKAAVDVGFEVIAIDSFADVDTQKLAKEVLQVPVNGDQFDAVTLLQTLQKIVLSSNLTYLGFCFGAGFEAQPELLTEIAQLIPLIGNAAEVVKNTKMPRVFFGICDTLKMAYPGTQYQRPIEINWLQKCIGGSGGWHIKSISPLSLPLNFPKVNQVYYQKKQAGTPISCLFLTDGKRTQLIGFNEQWCEPTATQHYRYGGAVSHVALPETVRLIIEQFVQAATVKLGLKGLNSADFLVEYEDVYALEINPRLSATLDLYRAKNGDLFVAHVAACLDKLEAWPTIEKQSRAHHIIYANSNLQVPPAMDWPDWVLDIPQPNSKIAAGSPICTAVAAARTAKLAKKKVLQLALSLSQQLF